jgi:hypothetical protein
LPRERIITVQVYARHYPSEHLLGRSEGIESSRGIEATSGPQGDYDLIIEGNQVISKFLRITQESRRVALKFYHVHLPCQLTTDPGDCLCCRFTGSKPGILYFNREYDFLRFKTPMPADFSLIDFLYDLKNTYAPCHVGLLNLAIKGDHITQINSFLDTNLRGKTSFLEIIAQLHEVFFLLERPIGRINYGCYSRIPQRERFNPSLPIMPIFPEF